MAENTKIRIDVELNTLKDLQKALKETKDEMVGLEAGSKGFREAAKRAGELKHQIDEINQSVRGASSDFGDMIGNITKAGAGITGAFQAAQGALNLFGAESEDVTKAIEKMQSIMALTQGLAAIDEGIKGFKKFTTAVTSGSSKIKVALASTGFGLLAVALGSIIANWEEFTKEVGLSEKEMAKFGEVFGGVMNVVLKSTGKIAKAFANIVKGDFKGAWDEIKSGWDFQEMYAEGVQKSITEREQKELKKRQEAHQEYIEEREKQLDTERSKAEATIDDEVERNKELIRIEQERLKLYKEGTKEYYDQLKAIKDLEAKDKTSETSTTSEEEDPEITKLRNKVQALKDSYRDELQVINDEEFNKLAAIQEARKKELITQQEFETLKTQIEQEASDKRAKIQQDEADLAAEYARMKMDAGLQMANNFASIFSSIADIIGEDSEEAFKASQAFQISSAIISTLSGAIGAYTGAVSNQGLNAIPIVGPALAQALGISNAVAVAASGAAQIAQISRRKWNDKSTSGLSASSGSARANVTSAARSVASPVQYTQDVRGAEIQSAIKDTRVYVTETDITDTQRRVSVVETENLY